MGQGVAHLDTAPTLPPLRSADLRSGAFVEPIQLLPGRRPALRGQPPQPPAPNPERETLDDRAKMTELERIRHSCAHVMATAILRLWPDAQFACGPPEIGRAHV